MTDFNKNKYRSKQPARNDDKNAIKWKFLAETYYVIRFLTGNPPLWCAKATIEVWDEHWPMR